MLTKIHDEGGTKLAEIELSDKQMRMLDAGIDITVIYHTPQMLRNSLGTQNGAFVLRRIGLLVVAKDVAGFKRYADLQRAIKAVQENA